MGVLFDGTKGIPYGADPDAKVKSWDESPAPSARPVFYRGPVGDLVKYFCYHRHLGLGRSIPDPERGALAKSCGRLLSRGFTPEQVRRGMDKYYLTKTSQTSLQPGFSFCSTNFQEQLFAGEGFQPLGDVETQEDAMTFIANGCDRTEDMVLPWPADMDDEIRAEFFDALYNVFLRTYPDVVADIITEFHDGDWQYWLDVAVVQYEWLQGVTEDPPVQLKELGEAIMLPKSFLWRRQRRVAKETLAAAVVEASRGR